MPLPISNIPTTGPGITVFVNGFSYGNVRSIRIREITNSQRRYGLDSPMPFDLIPLTNSADFTIECYLLIGEAGTGLQGVEIMPPPALSQSGQYASIILVSNRDQAIIFRSDTCSVVSVDSDIPARGLVTRTINFNTLDWTSDAILQGTPDLNPQGN